MARRILGLVGACLLGALSMAVAQEAQWIDLTHDLSEDAVFWPTANRFSMTTDFEGMTEKGYYYSAYSFTTAEHGGTHIDAPVHFAEGRQAVNEIPGPGIEPVVHEADETEVVGDRPHGSLPIGVGDDHEFVVVVRVLPGK